MLSSRSWQELIFDIRYQMRLHSAFMATKEQLSAAGKKANQARWAAFRRRGGRTLEEIAKKLGYTRQSLHNYRTGRAPWPPGLKKRYLELMRGK